MRPVDEKLNDFGFVEPLLDFDEIIEFDKSVEPEKTLALPFSLNIEWTGLKSMRR
jgi:hypothetical protein